MSANKIPPNNYEAERAFLACLLFNPENIQRVEYEISVDDFYHSLNAKIYEAIQILSKKVSVNYQVLASGLKPNETLFDHFVCLDLDNCVPHDQSLHYYISQIKNCALRRKQIELATKALDDAHNEKLDPLVSVEELKQHLEKSTLKEDISIVEVSEISEQIKELYEKGFNKGVSTGWNVLDQCYTVRPGEITLITGIPSHGKSTFCTNLISNIAKKDTWKFAVFSPENQPLQRYAAHIIQLYTNLSFDPHPTSRMTEGALAYAQEWTQNHFVFIQPRDDELQFSSIMKKAVICVLKHGIKGLVIDPWNEVDHTRPQGINETEYISKCLSKLRYFARTYQVHVWLIAHPTKLIKKQDGTYPVPTPYDISGSAHFRNKADCCLAIYRDTSPENYSTAIDIYIQKIRFHEVGRIGKVSLEYVPLTQSYA